MMNEQHRNMHQILSIEASRGGVSVGDSVSKRLCCSFIILVAFFSIVGGYLLGNFISKRTHHIVKLELEDISERITTLNNNLKSAFGNITSNQNCSRKFICYSYNMDGNWSSTQILDSLINCFSNV
ncbi:uncharacterized protein LOC123677731 [Harmonia axyridis]|uniref:uncharacterized protein LOC123677731 n=1 Tax=Harmonia axyridis TaxID=115357 RepID=UPI001E27770D|nr:uncharacterized protein LOC123677731 [Harmonia axyridis]